MFIPLATYTNSATMGFLTTNSFCFCFPLKVGGLVLGGLSIVLCIGETYKTTASHIQHSREGNYALMGYFHRMEFPAKIGKKEFFRENIALNSKKKFKLVSLIPNFLNLLLVFFFIHIITALYQLQLIFALFWLYGIFKVSNQFAESIELNWNISQKFFRMFELFESASRKSSYFLTFLSSFFSFGNYRKRRYGCCHILPTIWSYLELY